MPTSPTIVWMIGYLRTKLFWRMEAGGWSLSTHQPLEEEEEDDEVDWGDELDEVAEGQRT